MALLTLVTLGAALYTVVFGRWPDWTARRPSPFFLGCLALAVLLGGWGFKLAGGVLSGALPIR